MYSYDSHGMDRMIRPPMKRPRHSPAADGPGGHGEGSLAPGDNGERHGHVLVPGKPAGVPSEGAEIRKCATCANGYSRLSGHYSGTQWKRGVNLSRCTACVTAGVVVGGVERPVPVTLVSSSRST